MVVALLLGAGVGIVMGLTGAGGGILAVPLLVFGLHLTLAQAGPIGLLAVGISAGMGALIGLRAKTVRYRAALLIAASGIAMTPVGVWLAHRLDTGVIGLAFAVILLWVAYRSLAAAPHGSVNPAPPPCGRRSDSGRFKWTATCAAVLSIAGGIAGMLSGLLGVGGGFVMVPALQRFTDLDPGAVVATSLSVIALIALAGVIGSLSAGNLDLGVAVPFALGSVGGMGAGSVLSSRLPARHLKRAFALICLVVATGMVVKAL